MQALLHSNHNIENNILKLVLQQAGFIVGPSKDILKDIERLPEHPYDLIVISLGEETGDPLLLIKRVRSLSVAGLVLITETLQERHHINYLEAGADLIITRPYSSALFLSKIQALMRRAGGMPFLSLPVLT